MFEALPRSIPAPCLLWPSSFLQVSTFSVYVNMVATRRSDLEERQAKGERFRLQMIRFGVVGPDCAVDWGYPSRPQNHYTRPQADPMVPNTIRLVQVLHGVPHEQAIMLEACLHSHTQRCDRCRGGDSANVTSLLEYNARIAWAGCQSWNRCHFVNDCECAGLRPGCAHHADAQSGC